MKKVFALTIDGTPFSFLKKLFRQGKMSYFFSLTRQGIFKEIHSTIPSISCVAWASYMTGKNPGEHGIFGFVELDENGDLKISNTRDIKAKKIWQYLAEKDKRSIIINIPLTYPIEDIDGILISGFLTPNLEQITIDEKILEKLKKYNYIIDPDVKIAKDNPDEFLNQISEALEARKKITLDLMNSEKWDYFHFHIMETDRLFHFFWNEKDKIEDFFRELDKIIKEIDQNLPKGCELLIFSDHGFCKLEKELNLSSFFGKEAFSLVPGRVFVKNKKDIEKIKKTLLELRDPKNNQKIIKKVYRREEIYFGPLIDKAADLVALPVNGYDLKANQDSNDLFLKTHRQGMHTYNDACLFVKNKKIKLDSVSSIQNVHQLVLSFYD